MPSSTRRPAPRAGTSRASILGVLPRKGPHPNAPTLTLPRLRGRESSRGDEAVDLAVAEEPGSVLFDQLVAIGSTRADLWPVWAILHDCPVGAHPRACAVERDRDVGHQMGCAGPLISRTFPQTAGQFGDCQAAGCPAESGIPGAVLGEQRRHLGKLAVIEPEAVL